MARTPQSNPSSSFKPTASPEKKRGINPLFAGIIIGLLLGIGLALALAMWLNRAHNPFVEKARPVDALPPIATKSTTPPAPSAAGSAAAINNEKTDPNKPRFDFYQILPGEKTGKTETPRAATELPKAPAVDAGAKPAATTPPPQKLEIKPASTETYQLQAGAFQSQVEAENARGKVAFAGFEAAIRAVNLPDRGTLYRVRLGPYRSLDEVNRIKGVLAQNGINAAIVKGSD